jgi:beta-RFAP synthase
VQVDAPARLHLGFLDLNGSLGRLYGSLGLAIDKPATRLTLKRLPPPGGETVARAFRVRGPERERAEAALARFASHFRLEGPLDLTIEEAIPAHSGLGSGTQLAIAVGTAVSRLAGRSARAGELGGIGARGARSAIGMAAFERGGFLVDGGRGKGSRPAPILSRLDWPDDWAILLVLDPKAEGVHGDRELEAFRDLPPMPEPMADRLCRLTLMQLLPALAEWDLPKFGEAVTQIQLDVGQHFSSHQGGGIWSSDVVGEIMKLAGESGAHGIGQSSWGPTGFAFFETFNTATRVLDGLSARIEAAGLTARVVHGRNSGARVGVAGATTIKPRS